MPKRKGKKIWFIPGGRGVYWTMLLLFLLCCFCFAIVLSDGINEETLGPLYGLLFIFLLLIFTVRFRYSSYLIVSQQGVSYKKKTYEWKNIFITIDYRQPQRDRRYYDFVAYFGDHYLSFEEIKSKQMKRKGMFLVLTPKRIKFLLPFYQKKIKILREHPDMYWNNLGYTFITTRDTQTVLKTIKKHNLEQESCE